MTHLTAILLIIVTFLLTSPLHAQTDTTPPYLYYYSQLLGGLIIEHPDGTDSRQIAADVIPPNLTGLGGPGWSPSGKYFAASRVIYGDYNGSTQGVFLIDTQGNRVIDKFENLTSGGMQWSPTGEDWLLIIGTVGSEHVVNHPLSFWLVDAEARKVLVEYSGNFGLWPYESTAVIWETQQKQLQFYVAPKAFSDDQYFHITMRFDGTVLKEPTTKAEFDAHYIDPMLRENNLISEEIGDDQSVSPSGRYQTSGKHPTVLHDLNNGKLIELPIHTQGLTCQSIMWSTDEHYLITLEGIARTDSCGSAVIGVTTQEGNLWRELGGCGWGSPCVGWLPPQVHIADFPSGQPKPIQLDPVAYESTKLLLGWDDTQTIVSLRCDADLFKIVADQKPDDVLFQLQPDEPCPYNPNDSFANVGLQMTFAYNPQNKLLATYFGNEKPVSIWSMQTGIGVRILKLNTYGYELQFTDDGKYLRARNVNGWKIYSVADILAAAAKLHS